MVARRLFIKRSFYALPLMAAPGMIFNSFGPALPNVLLIGDSISIGYTPFVQELLQGKANVYRPMLSDGRAENCSGSTYGVKEIDRWINTAGVKEGSGGSGLKWDVIHFNFGLHDLKHVDPVTGQSSSNPKDPHQADVKQYKENLKIIVKKLKATGAKVIFATTTPVPENSGKIMRQPKMPAKYNKAVLKIMKRNGVYVNDLYSFVLPRMELQRPANVHFTDEGSKALGQVVAAKIAVLLA